MGESKLLGSERQWESPRPPCSALLRGGGSLEKGHSDPLVKSAETALVISGGTDRNARLLPHDHLVQTLFTIKIQNSSESHFPILRDLLTSALCGGSDRMNTDLQRRNTSHNPMVMTCARCLKLIQCDCTARL